jgi:murein L,D-transpeptidase YcbB/YkuD
MHFQLDRGPTAVDVDWRTVPGGGQEVAGSVATDTAGTGSVATDMKEDEMVLSKGAKNPAVTRFQECLLVWDSTALPKDGADGVFGSETVEWVGRFQESFGLEKTGVIDGVTAALLVAQGK